MSRCNQDNGCNIVATSISSSQVLNVPLQPRQQLHYCCKITLIVAQLLLQHPAQFLNVTLQPRQWLQHCCNIHLIFSVAECPTTTKTMVALLLQHSCLELPTLYVSLQPRQLLHCCCNISLIVELLLQHPAQLLNVPLQPRQWLQHCCNIHLIFTGAECPTATKTTVALLLQNHSHSCSTIVATSRSVSECHTATKTMVATLLQHPSHLLSR